MAAHGAGRGRLTGSLPGQALGGARAGAIANIGAKANSVFRGAHAGSLSALAGVIVSAARGFAHAAGRAVPKGKIAGHGKGRAHGGAIAAIATKIKHATKRGAHAAAKHSLLSAKPKHATTRGVHAGSKAVLSTKPAPNRGVHAAGRARLSSAFSRGAHAGSTSRLTYNAAGRSRAHATGRAHLPAHIHGAAKGHARAGAIAKPSIAIRGHAKTRAHAAGKAAGKIRSPAHGSAHAGSKAKLKGKIAGHGVARAHAASRLAVLSVKPKHATARGAHAASKTKCHIRSPAHGHARAGSKSALTYRASGRSMARAGSFVGANLVTNLLAAAYAVVEENTVTNIVAWDGVTPYTPSLGSALALLSALPGVTVGSNLSLNIDAPSINPPLIYEPPAALTAGEPQLWFGASAEGASPNWGGCFVYLSLDQQSWTQIATINGTLNQGALTAELPAFALTGQRFDTINTLAIDLSSSGAALQTSSKIAAQLGLTLCLVDEEVLAFQTSTPTGPTDYSLTGLQRGIFGTLPLYHTIGAPFARLDSAIAVYDLPPAFIGQTLYFAFASFNTLASGVEEVESCTVYEYTPVGAGTVTPIAAQLTSGAPIDLGFVTDEPAILEDLGAILGDAVLGGVDLGLFPVHPIIAELETGEAIDLGFVTTPAFADGDDLGHVAGDPIEGALDLGIA
jgi:hypothetical protein